MAYVPVLHEGYRRFFESHAEQARVLLLLDDSFIGSRREIQKDIRALDPKLIAKAVESWGLFSKVVVICVTCVGSIKMHYDALIMPDEDLSHDVARQFFACMKITFSPVFLRWDATKSTTPKEVHPDCVMTTDELHRLIMARAIAEGEKSSDWWRQVGGILVKDVEILLTAHNQHIPSEWTPYVDGDPRADFQKGVHVELSTGEHAEAVLIGEAASAGIALKGADLYMTDFPCPPCAKLVARSGIARLFYRTGYGLLDGVEVLRRAGVEIIQVQ